MLKVARKIGDQGGFSVSFGHKSIEDMSFRELKSELVDLAIEIGSLREKADEGSDAACLIQTIKANVANHRLTDSQFRQFMINTLLTKEERKALPEVEFTPEIQNQMEEELCQIAGSLQLNGVPEGRIIDQVKEKFEENKDSQLQEG